MTGWTATPHRDDPCWCGDDLAHCHGVLVLHAAGELECDEAGCAGDLHLHAWHVACCELSGGCGCEVRRAVDPPSRQARAA